MIKTRNRRNNYWLTLAACYGLTIGVATTIAMPWLLIVGGVFIFFPLVVGYLFGQIGIGVRGNVMRDSPAITLPAAAFSLIAILLRDSPVAGWAGPLLGLASFAGMYLCLRRYGYFHAPEKKTSTDQKAL
ncbi:hypothetical protein ACFUOZ_15140 [Paenarthrobacter sp. NPDC057355]|uniref:hypothetical protein n=1 Tax=Paenarthrobacter sp. NPDC057355 TaxID=3346105 RepID=UPI003639A3CA